MKSAADLFQQERRARLFFAVFAQSALGTGAAYVALLLIAFERFASAWAIAAVLIADVVAPMLLGPVFGAAADRWSRRRCAIAGDVLRLVAFLGVAFVDGFVATVALALMAGMGSALFKPATLAALPSLVAPARLPAATSVYGAVEDFGLAAGPAIAAVLLLFTGPETILIANAATFGLSAIALATIQFGRAPLRDVSLGSVRATSLLTEAKQGLTALRGFKGLWAVLAGSGTALFFGGFVNVAELPFVTEELGAREAVFSALVALAGVGIVAGSLAGARGGTIEALRRRYVLGMALMGLGFLASGLAAGYELLFFTFLAAGFGNGVMLVHERLIIQASVPDALAGRTFGTKDALTAWAFALSFVVAGAAASAFGSRPVVIAAGAGVTLVGVGVGAGLRLTTRGRRRLGARLLEADEPSV